MKISMNPIRGCIDFMPSEAERRQAVMKSILKTYKDNGFLQIKTPILENLELLCNNDEGENSTKLMFRTIKRGDKLNLTKSNLTDKDIVEEGLRYDQTVPLARFFANNRNNLPYPFKATQCDDSFRAERPQKGRYRQFTQCDIDILGEASILAEIEIISTVMAAYKNLGLNDLIVKINSRKILQDITIRAGFTEEEGTEICIIVDKIDKIGLDGVRNELLSRGFDESKIKALCELLKNIREQGLAYFKEQKIATTEVADMEQLISILKNMVAKDYDVTFDVGIVRGQSYYTGTVFEVFTKQGDYRGALCGGGRYDTMIEKMIGESVPAMGVGLGLDTTLLVLKEKGIIPSKEKKRVALIYNKNENFATVMAAKKKLMVTYEVSIMPQIKNQSEMERKLKLSNFDGVTTTNSQQIRWFYKGEE